MQTKLTKFDKDRERQTGVDKDRQRFDKNRQIWTKVDKYGQRSTKIDKHRQTQTKIHKVGQRQRKIDKHIQKDKDKKTRATKGRQSYDKNRQRWAKIDKRCKDT